MEKTKKKESFTLKSNGTNLRKTFTSSAPSSAALLITVTPRGISTGEIVGQYVANNNTDGYMSNSINNDSSKKSQMAITARGEQQYREAMRRITRAGSQPTLLAHSIRDTATDK
ncbi:unnamed protein product [Litomosoides sigmodontis]|uniref:Uncharacterized protein n=1 Tax=Litomosoides sigmodontis TaxID=42156 RepID=A0A3P6VA30_LITSI|nr:unnamed protein product [Litomosoides sigmodontis]